MEKKILQTNQCPFCFNKIDIRAIKCDKCRSDLTTNEAQNKIRKILDEQTDKKNKETDKNNQQKSHTIKIFFYVASFLLFLALVSLHALGYSIFFALAIAFVVYQDKVFNIIDKNYKIEEKNKFQKTIRKVIIGFLALIFLGCFIAFMQQATESPEHKLARQKVEQEQIQKTNEAKQKADAEAKRIADEKIKQEKAQREQEAPAKITSFIQQVKDIKTDKKYEDVKSIELEAISINAFGQIIKEYRADFPDNKEIQNLTNQLETSVKNKQLSLFPNLRKNYGTISKNLLWENDVEASVFGTGNSTIEFVGGVFASNKNIKEFYSKIADMLKELRFDRANFKWYSYDNGSYYEIESLKDGEFLIK